MATQEIPGLIGRVSLRQGLVALWCLVAVGCAQITDEPRQAAIKAAAAAPADTTPPATDEVPTAEPLSAPVAEVSVATQAIEVSDPLDDLPLAIEPDPAPFTVLPEDIALEASALVVAPEPPTVRESEPAAVLVPSPTASPAETLDFSSLVARLRKTKALSLRAKVGVKNESEELIEQFRAYHTQDGIVTLLDLRRSYDSLFQRLHSLLEDADPPLAYDIDRSQTAIWDFLADPTKFRASEMMAGA